MVNKMPATLHLLLAALLLVLLPGTTTASTTPPAQTTPSNTSLTANSTNSTSTNDTLATTVTSATVPPTTTEPVTTTPCDLNVCLGRSHAVWEEHVSVVGFNAAICRSLEVIVDECINLPCITEAQRAEVIKVYLHGYYDTISPTCPETFPDMPYVIPAAVALPNFVGFASLDQFTSLCLQLATTVTEQFRLASLNSDCGTSSTKVVVQGTGSATVVMVHFEAFASSPPDPAAPNGSVVRASYVNNVGVDTAANVTVQLGQPESRAACGQDQAAHFESCTSFSGDGDCDKVTTTANEFAACVCRRNLLGLRCYTREPCMDVQTYKTMSSLVQQAPLYCPAWDLPPEYPASFKVKVPQTTATIHAASVCRVASPFVAPTPTCSTGGPPVQVSGAFVEGGMLEATLSFTTVSWLEPFLDLLLDRLFLLFIADQQGVYRQLWTPVQSIQWEGIPDKPFDDTAGCFCNSSTKVMDCAGQATVPSLENCTNLEYLDLSGTRNETLVLAEMPRLFSLNARNVSLKAVEADTFAGLPRVGQLWLEGNEIGELKRGSFGSLTKLSWLFLGNSDIETVAPGAFDGLSNLEVLDLRDNSIGQLEAGVFDNMTKLLVVGLHRNRLLSYIAPGTFDGLSAVTNLLMGDNSLSHIDDNLMDNMQSLEWVDLSRNGLTALPSSVLQASTKLKHLDVSFNNLTVWPNLTEAPGLTSALLHGNSIAEVPPGAAPAAFAQLRMLLMHDNPSVCGYYLTLDSEELQVLCDCAAGYTGRDSCLPLSRSLKLPGVLGPGQNHTIIHPDVGTATVVETFPPTEAFDFGRAIFQLQRSQTTPTRSPTRFEVAVVEAPFRLLDEVIGVDLRGLPELPRIMYAETGLHSPVTSETFGVAASSWAPSSIGYEVAATGSSTAALAFIKADQRTAQLLGVATAAGVFFVNVTAIDELTEQTVQAAMITVVVNDCGSDTCSGSGVCVDVGDERDGVFECQCSPGFAGQRCELPVFETGEDGLAWWIILLIVVGAAAVLAVVLWRAFGRQLKYPWGYYNCGELSEESRALPGGQAKNNVQLTTLRLKNDTDIDVVTKTTTANIDADELSMMHQCHTGHKSRILDLLHPKRGNCPFVVECFGFISDKIVLRFYEQGSLRDQLGPGRRAFDGNAQGAFNVALDISKALAHLHSLKSPIFHRDVKPDNVFLYIKGGCFHAVLGDFGLATTKAKWETTDSVGTPGYRAPEILAAQDHRDYSKADQFAYGVTIAQLYGVLQLDDREADLQQSKEAMMGQGRDVGDPGLPDRVVRCVSEFVVDRPEMKDVVVELERTKCSGMPEVKLHPTPRGSDGRGTVSGTRTQHSVVANPAVVGETSVDRGARTAEDEPLLASGSSNASSAAAEAQLMSPAAVLSGPTSIGSDGGVEAHQLPTFGNGRDQPPPGQQARPNAFVNGAAGGRGPAPPFRAANGNGQVNGNGNGARSTAHNDVKQGDGAENGDFIVSVPERASSEV
eukprot:m.357307 g.357307  ORF g.357307 m.357307 type:complete len:1481 (-) comp19941_c3_seq2:156-4598(-)